LARCPGKHVAVAGQEPFFADTRAEARTLAEAAHPEEKGAMVCEHLEPLPGMTLSCCLWVNGSGSRTVSFAQPSRSRSRLLLAPGSALTS
jgi:hypothetical protein